LGLEKKMWNLLELEKEFSNAALNKISALSDMLITAKSKEKQKIITKGPFFNFRPYELERAGYKKGRQLNELPKNIKNTHVYHFDVSDKILYLEVYGQHKDIVSVEFYEHYDDGLRRIYYDSVGRLRNISFSGFVDGVLMKDMNWGRFGCSESDYIYECGRLTKILVRQAEHGESDFSIYEVRFEYKQSDLVSIHNVFTNGHEEKIFPS